MLSSIQTGLRALPSAASGIDAVMIALCDQPLVRSQTITQLVTAWSERRPRVLLPRFDGKHGHPIVLSAAGIEEIQSLDGKRGATLKDYTSRHERLDLEVDDPAVLHDIDTPEDFQKAVELLHRSD
jgi:molybdenum cofactor cytidylyltransferase